MSNKVWDVMNGLVPSAWCVVTSRRAGQRSLTGTIVLQSPLGRGRSLLQRFIRSQGLGAVYTCRVLGRVSYAGEWILIKLYV